MTNYLNTKERVEKRKIFHDFLRVSNFYSILYINL